MKKERLTWSTDDLAVNVTGPWAEEKYGLLASYLDMFSTAMKLRWDKRVYIDLYAGPGCTVVRETKQWFRGSPLLALSVKNSFDKYIFCERDEASFNALKERVRRHYSAFDVTLIPGDCNSKLTKILEAMPKHSNAQTVLSFCFVDPFSLDLQFATIQALSTKFVDFLVLLALDMDARRNLRNYFRSASRKVELFLGVRDWREQWKRFSQTDNSFQRFLAAEFEKQMINLGYIKHSRANTKHIYTLDRNLPLYHLAYFSRHLKGYQFWDKCKSYSSTQQSFDF
jgi:three-Cys-motif partner protein